MLNKIGNWLKGSPEDEQLKRKPKLNKAVNAAAERRRAALAAEANAAKAKAERLAKPPTNGRSRYIREDTGTHETLKIVDESLFDDTADEGIDPYNTGSFDKSKNWSKSYR